MPGYRLAIFLFVIVATADSQAQTDSGLAISLGSVLASEKPCDLVFDQRAVERFIEQRVRATDIEFPSNLMAMRSSYLRQIAGLDQTAKTAHCAQIRRLAKSFGFVP